MTQADVISTAIFDAWSRGLVGDAVVSYVLENTDADESEVINVLNVLYNAMKE
jgi:hypothetical protein